MIAANIELPPYLKQSITPEDGPFFTALRYPGEEGIVHVTAAGHNATCGFLTMFYIGAELVYPPRLHFANVPPAGPALEVITPFKSEFAYQHPKGGLLPGIPAPTDTITVYTVDGAIDVPVADAIVTPADHPVPWPWKLR